MSPMRADEVKAGDLVLVSRYGVPVFSRCGYVIAQSPGELVVVTEATSVLCKPDDILAVVRS